MLGGHFGLGPALGRPVLAWPCLGRPRLALAAPGLASTGLAMARLGPARGPAWLGPAWLGPAWLGCAWLGLAWLGHGSAWLRPRPRLVRRCRWIDHLMEFLLELRLKLAMLVFPCWRIILVEPSSCNLHEGTLV